MTLRQRGVGRVMAIDVDPCALYEARRNAKKNKVRGITWKCGKDYEPVVGRRFDLIVGQPPFVRSAAAQKLLFADGGPHGWETTVRWMTGAREHLHPGGVAYFYGLLPEERLHEPDAVTALAHRPNGVQVFLTVTAHQ